MALCVVNVWTVWALTAHSAACVIGDQGLGAGSGGGGCSGGRYWGGWIRGRRQVCSFIAFGANFVDGFLNPVKHFFLFHTEISYGY